ncbi:MAG: hypothetical protein NT154_16530, partial [Verrucomicrobia bacterium]|nr:hypothetical protein [Verrucomicrobiota bacterium]
MFERLRLENRQVGSIPSRLRQLIPFIHARLKRYQSKEGWRRTLYNKPGSVLALIFGCLLLQTDVHAASAAAGTIDDGQYADDAAAREAWEPMRGTAAASVALHGGKKVLRLACNFEGTNIERASWDRKLNLD